MIKFMNDKLNIRNKMKFKHYINDREIIYKLWYTGSSKNLWYCNFTTTIKLSKPNIYSFSIDILSMLILFYGERASLRMHVKLMGQ